MAGLAAKRDGLRHGGVGGAGRALDQEWEGLGERWESGKLLWWVEPMWMWEKIESGGGPLADPAPPPHCAPPTLSPADVKRTTQHT